MKRPLPVVLLALLSGTVFTLGCASTSPRDDVAEVWRTVGERRAGAAQQSEGIEGRSAGGVESRIVELAHRELSPEEAVELALLASDELEARMSMLGIARAEFVEATRIPNPVLSLAGLWPGVFAFGGSGSAKVEGGLALPLLELIGRPARKHRALAELEGVRLHTADEVLALVGAVESDYIRLVAVRQRVAIRAQIEEAAAVSAELARRLVQAGNASRLALAREEAAWQTARVRRAQAEGEAAAQREAFSARLGLWGERGSSWSVPSRLPDLPAAPIATLAALERLAIERRLDLQVAAKQVESAAAALGLVAAERFLHGAEIGAAVERELEGEWITGPELAIEVPVFRGGRAKRARRVAELRTAEAKYRALVVRVRGEVRERAQRLATQREVAEYLHAVTMPLREQIVDLVQREHNFMLVGVFDVLAARAAEYAAYEDFLDAVRDFHIARVDLQRATGGELPVEMAADGAQGAPGAFVAVEGNP